MQKVIELNIDETKAVVGGVAAASVLMRKESPVVAEIIGLVRDFEDAFGGGRMVAKRLQ